MQHPSLFLVVLVPLIAWRMYSRIRRLVGRQRSFARRHWMAAVLFPLLVLLLALSAFSGPESPAALAALAGGVVVGLGLAVFGLRSTRFEATEQGLFYTPTAHIGVALSVLMFCRVGYRLFQTYEQSMTSQAAHSFGTSPLTLLVFGMLAGYYATYAMGLLRWRKAVGA